MFELGMSNSSHRLLHAPAPSSNTNSVEDVELLRHLLHAPAPGSNIDLGMLNFFRCFPHSLAPGSKTKSWPKVVA